jgi:sugar (pentulose or hexulose) kinase
MDTRPFFNGAYGIVGASLGGGTSYEWLRRQINQEKGNVFNYSEMDELAAQPPPGSDGLFFCTGSTRQQIDRRRGFFGNVARLNSIPHRARAVLEGVLMDLFESYDILRTDDQNNYLVAGGKGMQNSRIWSQVAADLFGKPVQITGPENAVLGAALMAEYGNQYMDNLEAAAHSIRYIGEMTPNPIHTKFYRDEYVKDWHSLMRDRQ